MDHKKNSQVVLIADDDPKNLKLLCATLHNFGYEIQTAVDGKDAVQKAMDHVPDLILLDICMPEMDGYEACRRLKANTTTRDIPIIFVSALDDSFNKVKGFELGAVDYLTKPIEIEETRVRVRVHLELRNKIRELEMFNQIMVEREMRIIDLKKELNALAAESGRRAPYPEVWEGQPQGDAQ